MKIINPFNLLMYAVIYLLTLHYLRMKPTTGAGRVGWASEEGEHGVAYDPMTGAIHTVTLDSKDRYVVSVAVPDGSVAAWFRTPKIYYTLLHHIVGDYLDYNYPVEDDD